MGKTKQERRQAAAQAKLEQQLGAGDAEQAAEIEAEDAAQEQGSTTTEAAATEQTTAPAPKAPKVWTAEDEKAEVERLNTKHAGARVLRVVEWGKRGATRVVVGCCEEGCGQTREIAVQDAFQVRRCSTHQKTAGRKGRSAKRTAAVAALKAENDALKAKLAEAGLLDEPAEVVAG